ncbi:MAG: HlyD family efflux transporter periplasmic adaptor subunit, partial [Candidatus Paceibacterota bacterium]
IYGKLTSTVGETQYITTTVKKGTIISSVTASGQVESSSQIDLKSDISDTIVYVGVKPGDKVTRGKTLFSIDNKDAQKAIRDAEISLESAKISLEKLKIENSNENMDADLVKVYDDGFNAVLNTFYDLNSTITGLDDMLAEQGLSDNDARLSGKNAQNYRDKAVTTYYAAQNAFTKTNKNYRTISNTSKRTDINNIIEETYNTTKLLAEAIKNTASFVDYIAQDSNTPSNFTSYQNTLSTYTNTISGHLSDLLSAQNNIKSNEDSSQNANLDIQSAELSVRQKENALQDAKDKLSDYYVSAPFDGTIASVTGKVGDTASGTLGSIITNQKIATLSMNEVDVSKIQLGQKATITFDAIEDLSMAGTVAEIDTMGTVSQGVVSYSVKIAFDTEDAQIKPGMSVSATITTDSKTDILMVPSSAIKTNGVIKYVQMFTIPLASPTAGSQGTPSTATPIQIKVETGITDDTSTEIIFGLKEGEQIVSRVITSTASTTKSTSILGNGRTPGM